MRPIKFRAWIYDNLNKKGRMYYASDFGSEGKLLDYTEEHCDWSMDFLMQFTGLKDKNGKEIYEGDILQDNKGNRYEVIWYEICACYELRKTDYQRQLNALAILVLEVIGNIHENHELMEQETK